MVRGVVAWRGAGCVQGARRVRAACMQGGVAPGEAASSTIVSIAIVCVAPDQAASSARCRRAAASTAAPLLPGRECYTAATAAGPPPRQTGRRRCRSLHRARSRLRAPCAAAP
eukprot:scaffold20944_cov56-Phaeocystis_antarctica.AAC.2